MTAYCLIAIVLQGVTMVVDEGWFHRERGLARWERIGHPLDTLSIALCLGWLVAKVDRATDEAQAMCRAHDLSPVVIRGSRPRLGWPLWRILATGKVGDDVAFTTTPSSRLGYTGIARRGDAPAAHDTTRGPHPRRAWRGDLCDGSRDGEPILVDEVRARSVRDRGSRAG